MIARELKELHRRLDGLDRLCEAYRCPHCHTPDVTTRVTWERGERVRYGDCQECSTTWAEDADTGDFFISLTLDVA